MRTLLAIPIALAIALMTSSAGNAANEVVCGVNLGFQLATANAPGSVTLGQTPPAGYVGPQPTITVVIAQGDRVTGNELRGSAGGYLCVEVTPSGTSRTFVAVVPPGAAGYVAQPVMPAPNPMPTGHGSTGVGTLPTTSTAPSGTPIVPLMLACSGLLALGAIAVRRRRAVR